MAGKSQQVSDNLLRYGDYVTLRNMRWTSFLSGDGLLNNDVFVSDDVGSFENHIFQVQLQRQYSAKSEYEDFLVKRHQLSLNGVAIPNDDAARKHFDALSKGKSNEVTMNDLMMKHKTGTTVKFGDVIQLLHVKSKKFLFVPGKDLARDERENMLITLSTEGGINSWIQLLPRFKINKEGDNVANNTECVLRISERGLEHFHCSERMPPGVSRFREVNASMETQSAFRLSIYNSTQFPVAEDVLMLGELVYIRDPEVASNLQTFASPGSVAGGGKKKRKGGTAGDEDEESAAGSLESCEKEEEDDEGSDDVSITSAEEFEHEFGTVSLKPSGDTLNTNCVWVMESQTIVIGGALVWRSDQVYFRHLNTGLYLTSYDPTKLAAEDGGDEEDGVALNEQAGVLETCCFTTIKKPTPKRSLFTISALHASGDHLESSGAIQLRQGDMYLERSPVYNDRWKTYPCAGTRNKMKAVGLIINKYSEVLKELGSRLSLTKPQPAATDIHYSLAMAITMKRYLDHMKVPSPRDNKQPNVWPALDEGERKYFSECVVKINRFIKGIPITSDSLERVDFRANPQVVKRRQDMFLDQGALEHVVGMLSLLVPVSDRLTSKDAVPQQFTEGGLLATSRIVISECLTMLYDATSGNKTNQMFISEYMPVILAHCSTDPLAAKITQELLATNRELQETKITAKDINVFSEKIKETGMTSMFLRLLQACCANTNSSGEQEGVQRNQVNVLHILFNVHKDALIRFVVNYNDTRYYNWLGSTDSAPLFVPGSVAEANVMGAQMFSSGLLSLKLTWQTKISDLNPQSITGKNPVKLGDIFRIVEEEESGVSSRTTMLGTLQRQASMAFSLSRSIASSVVEGSAEKKRQVGEFLVAQLYLAANLCVGRNYNSLVTLQEEYAYPVLITLMKDSLSPPALQGAAACLLTNLYIDRDPQLSVALPRLTRTWTEIVNPNAASIYSIAPDRVNLFMLPQLIISSHLRSLKDRPFTEATLSILQMLRKLIIFGFYGDRDKLNDIIVPLLGALKRDEIIDETQENGEDKGEDGQKELLQSTVSSLSIKSKQKAVLQRRMAAYKVNVLADGENEDQDEDAAVEMTSLIKSKTSTTNEVEVEEKGVWQEKVLNVLESLHAMCFILLVVVLAVAEAIWSYSMGAESLPHGMSIFEYVVFAIFAADVTMRAYCHKIVRKKLITFVSDIFNIFDIAVVLLDVIIFIEEAASVRSADNGEGIGKVLRVVRVLRVLRAARFLKVIFIYRAMQVVNAAAQLISGNDIVTFTWKEPERFSNTNESNLRNMIEMCHILESIQQLVEDRNISLLLQGFHSWNQQLNDATKNGDIAANAEKIEKLEKSVGAILLGLEGQFENLQVSSPEWDDIYLDLLMYNSPKLVQGSLNILMAHHCNMRAILENCHRIQLLVNQRRETQYRRIESLIKSLNSYVDTFEVWCTLKKEDSRKINTFVHDALIELAQTCCRRREVLHIDEELEPDNMVQDILRNLGAFDLCIRIMHLHSSIDVNNTISLQHSNTRQLVLEASRVIYWMTLDNLKSQTIAYGCFKFFIKLLDEKVESHRIIAAIFRNNEFLVKNVPKQYISDFVNMIINQGRFPQYLTFLSSIATVGEQNVIENQYEIIRLISAPYNQKKCVMYFVPSSHPSYGKKIKDMAPFLNKKDPVTTDLPSDLAYHLDLIELLGKCTVGREGMTTIEAKVQSMYSFVDIIDSILDPACLIGARVRYGQFLYNAMLEVEMKLPSLKDSKLMWDLLESFQDVVAFAKDEVRQIEKNGWAAPTSNRQKIEYMLVSALVVAGYFGSYFDHSIFQPEVGATQGIERVQIREKRAWEIVLSLFYKYKAIYDMQTPLLSKAQQQSLFEVLEILNLIPPTKIVMKVENLHIGMEDPHAAVSAQEKSLASFIRSLASDDDVKEAVNHETMTFIEKLMGLPKLSDASPSNVRYEAVLERLVLHVRGTIQVTSYGGETTKFIDPQATRTNTWIIRIFRLMIEKMWGMTILERDDDGGEEQDEAVKDITETLNKAGATDACLELIARGISPELQAEAINLLVAMLFKEGGAGDVQRSIHNNLSRRGSDMFFLHMRSLLQSLIQWHKWNGVVILEEGEDVELHAKQPNFILVRMLQLMCEGHFRDNQDILREQPNNQVSVNLLDDMVAYIIALDTIPCRTSTEAGIGVTALILEVIQGPCQKNQDHFALTSELLETMNRKLRQRPINDCDPEAEFELKKTLIDILQALIEGQGRRVAIFERVLSVIHLDVIKHIVVTDPEEDFDAAKELQTESLVLLKTLIDFHPGLAEELEIGQDELGHGTNVVSIEVVWEFGGLQRRFFPVPEICNDLAKSTKDAFIINADRSSNEGKLIALLQAGKGMYIEILHQQLLKEYGLAVVFSRKMLEYVSWFSLGLVCIINALFLAYYQNFTVDCDPTATFFNSTAPTSHPTGVPTARPTARPTAHPTANGTFAAQGDGAGGGNDGNGHPTACLSTSLTNPSDGTDIGNVAFGLGIVLILTSGYCLINCWIVRIPVVFRSVLEADGEESVVKALLSAAADGPTMYQTGYLLLTIFALMPANHHLMPILLLDIISKSKTTQDTLMALWKPRLTIILAMLLTFIFCYLFAIFHFYFVGITPESQGLGCPGNQYSDKSDQSDVTLRNSFMQVLRWGSPYGSLTKMSDPCAGVYTWRWVWDFWFFIMCFIMWSIIKGITIDTFVELREDLQARTDDTSQKCFMCGIERMKFNKAIARDAFDKHIKNEQNLWNYIYYFIFIWEQDKDDDDGLEYSIRHAIDAGDLGWFPLNKAITLTEHLEASEATSLQSLFREDLRGLEKDFDQQVVGFKDELGKFITRVENTLMFAPDPVGATRGRQSRSRGQTGAFTTPGSPRTGGGLASEGGMLQSGRGNDHGLAGNDDSRAVDVTVLSADGMVIPPEIADRIQCKVIADLNTTLLPCGVPDEVEGADGKAKVSFDSSQRLLCHRGKVPPDSQLVLRLVLLYKALKPGDPLVFLGAVDVPISACVAAVVRANTVDGVPVIGTEEREWTGTLQVAAQQKAFLLPEQINHMTLTLSVAAGNTLISDVLNAVISPSPSVVDLPELGAVAADEADVAEGSTAEGGAPSLDGGSVFEP